MQILGIGWRYNGRLVVDITNKAVIVVANGKRVHHALRDIKTELCSKG